MAVALFVASAVFLLYFFLGYPILLLVLGKLRPKPIRKAFFTPSVSVIIPVRNGEKFIEAKLRSVFALHYPRELLQTIVLGDGCTDRTLELARAFPGVEVIELPAGGKCKALNRGIAAATGEILFFTDVRQELESECLANLVANFADPTIGVASGELVLVQGDRHEHQRLGLYTRYEEWLRKQISKVGSVAGATGAVYTMRRTLAVQLPEDVLLDDVYQPLGVYFQGYRVILDGSAIAYDIPVRIEAEFRRKVRTLAGLYQICYHYPRLFDPREAIWLHFLSHKFSRLLLPYAFLCCAVTSFWLPDPWRILMIAGQAGFYGAALVDPLVPESFPLKKLTSLCRTFGAMLAASLMAGRILFVPARSLWKEQRS
jgi:biofilm PGA synthesis N-glycosyltransferase PgaC